MNKYKKFYFWFLGYTKKQRFNKYQILSGILTNEYGLQELDKAKSHETFDIYNDEWGYINLKKSELFTKKKDALKKKSFYFKQNKYLRKFEAI